MKPLTDSELVDVIDNACANYQGKVEFLKGAIGALVIARQYGWKPAFLMFNPRSIRKYEKILGIKIRDRVPEFGPCASKSEASRNMRVLDNYWKAVSGDIKGIRSCEIVQ